MWLIVVWSPQYGCTGDLPRNPDVRSNGVDSFDFMLLVIRAKGGGWVFKTTWSSVLVVVIGDNSKQYSRSAVGCLGRRSGSSPRGSSGMCVLQTRGYPDDVQAVDGQTVAGAVILSTSDYHFLVIAVAANLFALGSVSSCWLIVVWSPQYGCTEDYPRNPDVPKQWSRLVRLHASGHPCHHRSVTHATET